MLYGARRYPEARAAFASLQGQVSGDDRELVDLRIAECDFFLKRYAGGARRRCAPIWTTHPAKAEARFFALSAQRELGPGRRVHRGDARAGGRVPGQLVVRRSAQQSRDLLHPDERGRARREDLPRAVREVSRRARAPSAPPGSTAGISTRPATTPRRSGCSRAPRRRSAARTTGRRSSTGPPARTARPATALKQTSGSGSCRPTTGTRTTGAWRA